MPPDDHISSKSSRSSASENTHPTRSEAEEAVRILIKWMGDDPTREGLIDTPKRVERAVEALEQRFDKINKERLDQ